MTTYASERNPVDRTALSGGDAISNLDPSHNDTEIAEDRKGSVLNNELDKRGSMKFEKYSLDVDPMQDDRAMEIKLCSFQRPHMRAFHYAWWCYHVAFLMWFSITPLLSEVESTLGFTREQVWTSSITAVSGTIVMRFALGPFCDKYGPRIPMGLILIAGAVPTGLTGFVNTASGLAVLRFFIGVGGSTFVMVQYWTTRMFTREWVGTANATVAGWGNLGGGVTQLLVGSFIFPLLKVAYGGDPEKAWRTACIVPSILGFVTAYCVVKYTDDSPHGNYSKMKKLSIMKDVSVVKSFKQGLFNYNTWLIFVQYACCFGVEITMNNAAALYFKSQFLLSTEKAAAVASVFGWMNLFARGLGGFISDKANARLGMRGRLLWQSVCLLLEGCMVVVFALSTKLSTAILVLVIFSIFVQAAEGSSFGIVPYINPSTTGSTSGIVGAGGNVGAVVFGICFRQMSDKSAFIVMGCIIMFSSLLSVFVRINGHSSTLNAKDVPNDYSSKVSDTEDTAGDSPPQSSASLGNTSESK